MRNADIMFGKRTNRELKRTQAVRNIAVLEAKIEENVSNSRQSIRRAVETGEGTHKLAANIKMCRGYERLQSQAENALFHIRKDELTKEMRKIDGLQYDRLKDEEHALRKQTKRWNPKTLSRRLGNVGRMRDRQKTRNEEISKLLDTDSDDDDDDANESNEYSVEMQMAKDLIDEDICHKMIDVPMALKRNGIPG